MTFHIDDNISFVHNDLGLNPERMTILRDALTKTQAQCDENDEGEIRSALDIVDLGISKLGTPQDVPTLTRSEASSSDSYILQVVMKRKPKVKRASWIKRKNCKKGRIRKNKETHRQMCLN